MEAERGVMSSAMDMDAARFIIWDPIPKTFLAARGWFAGNNGKGGHARPVKAPGARNVRRCKMRANAPRAWISPG